MNERSLETAVILANGLFRTPFAKTAHGLVRGPSRYRVVGIIDASCAGEDAGELLDGRARGIPVFESVSKMVESLEARPDYCVIGVATSGGVMPPELRADLVDAAQAGISLVNGLHQLLADDRELVDITQRQGAQIIDVRRPRPTSELNFWTGEVLSLETPRVAILGTDCAIGKRTTGSLLVNACRDAGLHAEMIFTGQTGWLQGYPYGFILDATPNDFVCGELESAILACQRETEPDLIFIEGQSSLRNPMGPCGSELILAGGTRGVILQHAPARQFFDELEELGCRIPPIEEEIDLIGFLGAEVWAVTLSEEYMVSEDLEEVRLRMVEKLGIPVALPLRDDLNDLVEIIKHRIDPGKTP
jgi:uncharacterized NAD-dependent epimerase/dehydratase family protein